MSYTLFLSHNAADSRIVHEIKRRSEAAGLSVYTYDADVRAGSSIVTKLTEAIKQSDGLVAILTRNGASRPAIQQEIGVAVGLGKPVYPLVEDGVDAATLTLLQGIEYIRLDLEKIGDALIALQTSVTRQRSKERNEMFAAVILLLAIATLVYLASRE